MTTNRKSTEADFAASVEFVEDWFVGVAALLVAFVRPTGGFSPRRRMKRIRKTTPCGMELRGPTRRVARDLQYWVFGDGYAVSARLRNFWPGCTTDCIVVPIANRAYVR